MLVQLLYSNDKKIVWCNLPFTAIVFLLKRTVYVLIAQYNRTLTYLMMAIHRANNFCVIKKSYYVVLVVSVILLIRQANCCLLDSYSINSFNKADDISHRNT